MFKKVQDKGNELEIPENINAPNKNKDSHHAR